jgi:hypothetical protein
MAKPKLVVGQIDQESMQDFIKFRVFCGLGAARNLEDAYKKYYETNNAASPVWKQTADKYHWAARAAQYDEAHAAPVRPAK